VWGSNGHLSPQAQVLFKQISFTCCIFVHFSIAFDGVLHIGYICGFQEDDILREQIGNHGTEKYLLPFLIFSIAILLFFCSSIFKNLTKLDCSTVEL